MRALVLSAALAVAACAASGPAPLDTKNDACSWCRMAVSDGRFAAQLVVPGEDARFFDDIGCLANYLRSKHGLPKGARLYVTDHLTHAWIDAGAAVYTRVESVETPMGTHLLAHANAGLRGQDAEATGGQQLSAAEVFGASVAAEATR